MPTSLNVLTLLAPSVERAASVLGQFFLLALLLASFGRVHAQEFDHYQRMRSDGPIPEDFLLNSLEKYQLELFNLDGDERRNERKAKKEFYVESSYYINQLLLSGRVLFNDPVSEYVGKIADYLLRDQPDLRKQLRFYIVKSPVANAFATNNGLILINLGLIAKLESEAQLAYVLSHEISHFVKKHPLDIFLEARNIERNTGGIFSRGSIEDVLVAKNIYSREKEQEADLYGLELYRQTAYDLDAVRGTFDVLEQAQLPFSSLPFDRHFLESPHLSFPDHYFLDTVRTWQAAPPIENEADRTHPDPKIRKQILEAALQKIDASGRKKWVIGPDQFMYIQKICRFEGAFQYLYKQAYEEAIYAAFVLLQEEPNSHFLKKIIAQALYALSKYTNGGRFWDIHVDYDERSGEVQQVYHLTEKMSEETRNVTALIYAYQLLKTDPDDIELKLICRDLIEELGKHYFSDIHYFATESRPLTHTDSLPEPALRYALADLLQEKQFTSWMKEGLEKGGRWKREQSTKVNHAAEQEELTLKGFNLGLDRVVFVDPFYQRIDYRQQKALQYVDSEENEAQLIRRMCTHAKDLELDYQLLNSNELEAGDILSFNDLSLLSEWIEEKTRHEDLELVSINHNEVQYLVEKYHTAHFVWTGAISLTAPKSGKGVNLFAGIVLVPFYPYALFNAISPNHSTYFYTMVYDLKSGTYQILFPKFIRMRDTTDVMNSVIYDLLFQIKEKPVRP